MGLLDYYRQFTGMSDQEVSTELRRRADEQRSRELARIEPLDLARTTWHEFPHPDVAAAVTFAARRSLNRVPDPGASELRRDLARRHGLEPGRVAVGDGAAALLRAAAEQLLAPGDQLVTPWPSYPLYPMLARRTGAHPVPVALFDVDALTAALGERTRLLVLCNPNDPTGAHLDVAQLDGMLGELPERVSVLLDEALVDFVDEPGDTVGLLDDHPRLLIFRTFSKAYGLAGLRCGYVLGARGSEPLLERLGPDLGVATPIQTGALEALRACGEQVARRRATVVAERRRLLDALPALGVDAAPSQANFAWLRVPGLSAAQLVARLERHGVTVHSGAAVGDDDHVRAAIQSPAATDRLLDALGRVAAARAGR